jgi:hypothetical protein
VEAKPAATGGGGPPCRRSRPAGKPCAALRRQPRRAQRSPPTSTACMMADSDLFQPRGLSHSNLGVLRSVKICMLVTLGS